MFSSSHVIYTGYWAVICIQPASAEFARAGSSWIQAAPWACAPLLKTDLTQVANVNHTHFIQDQSLNFHEGLLIILLALSSKSHVLPLFTTSR